MSSTPQFIRTFADLGRDDVAVVGGKNASLGEMYRHLTSAGVRVPNGFAVTAEGYRHVLEEASLYPRLHELFDRLDHDDVTELTSRAGHARSLVYDAGLPADLTDELRAAYRELEAEYGAGVSVAVRSSATAEDLPTASFAGQHDSFLNVCGEDQLVDAVRRCFASVFTDRGVHYRAERGYGQLDVALSVGVMRMVRSDIASSGVLFTLDTETGFRDVVLTTAAYGLGENIVQGTVDPDEFYVHKPTYAAGHRAVLRHRLGGKAMRMVLADGEIAGDTHNEPTPAADRDRYCLTDAEVLELAANAMAIESHYGCPMDIEWAKDGIDGKLYIVQARPETVTAARSATMLTSYTLDGDGEVLVTGRSVGDQIASGPARVVESAEQLDTFRPGEVLVADLTTPDWEPVMKLAAAVVTNRGGRTCHAAIVARELGIPAIVGTGDATTRIPTGTEVTVSCAGGSTGHAFRGRVPWHIDDVAIGELARPRTKIMVNIANPDAAFATAALPNDGVGLARMEFVFTEQVGVHPMAALHPERVTDPEEQAEIERLVAGYPDGAAYVVDRLAEGIATIAAAFYPKPVVVRMSDFKTNEYAALLGGAAFEPHEENPMLGFRGASRYAHPAYTEAFALECEAIRRVREDVGLTNVIPMLPFVRRLAEADRVLARMAELGLKRGRHGLQVYAMCEIPNNVTLVDEFAQRFDGMSIGSNDLTQLTLGTDRDSALLDEDYDERDPGVLKMIELAVEGCRRNGIHSGLCGQAPSDYPDFAEFLVRIGIDSISLSPDSLVRTTRAVLDLERSSTELGGPLA